MSNTKLIAAGALGILLLAGLAFVLRRPDPASGPGRPAVEREEPPRPALADASAPGRSSASKAPADVPRASLPDGHPIVARVDAYLDRHRRRDDLRARARDLKKRLESRTLPDVERPLLEADLARAEREADLLQDEIAGLNREIKFWLAEDSTRRPVELYDSLASRAGVLPRGAGRLLAGCVDHADLEPRILRDLAAGAPAAAFALEAAEARSTRDRIAAVSGMARQETRPDVSSLAVRVLSGYKEAPETVGLRGEVYQTLFDVACGEGAPESRCQALMGLGRERVPSDALLTMVRDLSRNDRAESVRAAAGHVLRRWEERKATN